MTADNPTITAQDAAKRALESFGARLAALQPPPKPRVEPVPPFPLDSLPPTVRTYVLAGASSARVPPEMVALPLLAFLGSAIGNQMRIDVGNGWVEYPALWVVLVTPTGGGKTPAILAARKPLDLLQDDAWSRSQETLAGTEPQPWAGSVRSHERAPFDRYYTTDPGMSALVEDLAHVPGIAIVRDELIGIVRAMSGSGSRRDDRQHYLALWSSHPIAPSRRRETAWVPTPVVSIVGGAQPLVVQKLRSNDQDGLVERFLPIFIGTGARYWNETAVQGAPVPDVAALASLIARLRHGHIPPAPEGLLVGRTPEAGRLWAVWYNDNVDHIHSAPRLLAGFYQKLASHVARFALILHAIWEDDVTRPLAPERMTQAIALGEFCRAHIRRTMLLLGELKPLPQPAPTLRERILRVLHEEPGPDGWLSRTHLQVRLARPPAAEFNEAILLLLDRGSIVHDRRKSPGSRKSADHYRLA